jgi:transmembrane sensor
MTVPPRTSGNDPLFDEALERVVRLNPGTPTQADLDALGLWRRRSGAQERALRVAARACRRARTAVKQLAEEEAAGTSRLLARRAVLVGTLAMVAAYVTVRPPFGLWPSIQELAADYRTGKGERRKVALAPAVSVELNTQTCIALRSAADETRVDLFFGEVSVDTKISSKPLVMLAGNGGVIASQANFDARCFGRTVSVACLDGDHGRAGWQFRAAATEAAGDVFRWWPRALGSGRCGSGFGVAGRALDLS